MGERVSVCKRGGDFFSVCIPGNCSAALLNNEMCVYTVCMCVCVYTLVARGGNKDTRSQQGKKLQMCLIRERKQQLLI